MPKTSERKCFYELRSEGERERESVKNFRKKIVKVKINRKKKHWENFAEYRRERAGER